MSEQSVASARASVLVYDSGLKKWVPSGSSNGLSKVHIYHHLENNTFRVVGRMLQGHEVVINCSILKGLKYFQATPTFHQWRDNSQIHGLNFASREDAETFALAMERVLEILGHSSMYLSSARSNQSQPLYQTIGHSGVSLDDYAEYRGWMNHENGEKKPPSEYSHYRVSHMSQPPHSASNPNTPATTAPSPSPVYGTHPRASSAPPQPSPQAPPPPPPPPPPPSNNMSGMATMPRLHYTAPPQEEESETSLAAAIAAAKLKKTNSSKPNEGNGEKSFPPLKGMACMMDEMARTLARRRAQTDTSLDSESSSERNRSLNAYSPNKTPGEESPQSVRSRPDGECDRNAPITMNDLLRFREDILAEVRSDLQKIKQEIIEAVRIEISRR